MEENIFIYGLIDPLTNELRYIGKSIKPKLRLRRHISDRNKHDSYKDRWLRKLMLNNIKPELIIIDEVSKTEWEFWEIHYISYYKFIGCSLTNGTIGGDQPPSTKGRKHNDISRQKMSESKLGKPIPWLNTGKERTKKHRNNLSKSLKGRESNNKGKKYSNTHKEKLRRASTCKKTVLQLTIDGDLIKEWPSVNLAQKELKLKHISECCREQGYKTVGGFKWKYKEQNGK